MTTRSKVELPEPSTDDRVIEKPRTKKALIRLLKIGLCVIRRGR